MLAQKTHGKETEKKQQQKQKYIDGILIFENFF